MDDGAIAKVTVSIVVAMTRKRVIAAGGRLPWHIPEETSLYRETVADGTVLMGRRTFLQMNGSLPGRRCVVLSSTGMAAEGIDVCGSIDAAMKKAKAYGDEVFVLGGAAVYAETIGLADRMHISYIKRDYRGDLLFPEFDDSEWEVVDRQDYADFEHVVYARISGRA